MGALFQIYFIILSTLFITQSAWANPACDACINAVVPTYVLGIPKDIFYILMFLILLVIFCITVYLFRIHKNKIISMNKNSISSILEKKEELENLFALKEKGIITEQQFEQKKSDILNK